MDMWLAVQMGSGNVFVHSTEYAFLSEMFTSLVQTGSDYKVFG